MLNICDSICVDISWNIIDSDSLPRSANCIAPLINALTLCQIYLSVNLSITVLV